MKGKPFLPAIVWVVIIFAVISWPADQIPENEILTIPHFDKLIHFFCFFIWANLLAYGLHRQSDSSGLYRNAYAIALIAGILYAGLTELFQLLFFESRHGNINDFFFNVFGMVFGLFFYKQIIKHRLIGG